MKNVQDFGDGENLGDSSDGYIPDSEGEDQLENSPELFSDGYQTDASVKRKATKAAGPASKRKKLTDDLPSKNFLLKIIMKKNFFDIIQKV